MPAFQSIGSLESSILGTERFRSSGVSSWYYDMYRSYRPWIVPRKRSAVLCQMEILFSRLLIMRHSHNGRGYREFAPPGSHMCSGYSELHVGASRMARRVILFEFSSYEDSFIFIMLRSAWTRGSCPEILVYFCWRVDYLLNCEITWSFWHRHNRQCLNILGVFESSMILAYLPGTQEWISTKTWVPLNQLVLTTWNHPHSLTARLPRPTKMQQLAAAERRMNFHQSLFDIFRKRSHCVLRTHHVPDLLASQISLTIPNLEQLYISPIILPP